MSPRRSPAIKVLFPTLEEQQTSHPYLANWGEIAEQFQNQPALVINREVEVEKDFYQQSIHFDEEYQFVRVYGTIITQHKQAERALRKSEKRLRSITENAPGFIAELDLQGNFLYVNHSTAIYSLEELNGVAVYDVTPVEFHDAIRNLLELTASSGEMQVAEFGRVEDGKEYWQAAR